MKVLCIGDMHATPSELGDCEAVMELAYKAYKDHSADAVFFLGDQYNNHDVMSVRVMEFWRRWFSRFEKVFAIVGNHDQSGAGLDAFHAMNAHSSISVIDTPQEVCPGVVAMPYIHEAEDFYAKAASLKANYPGAHTLFCHATVDGSQYENGMYAPDGLDIGRIPFDLVISGHIHTPQEIDKVNYLGAPRWRTKSDANIDRFLYMMELGEKETSLIEAIPTGPAARRIWSFDDFPQKPAQYDVEGVDLNKDDVRVDVYGPLDHVKEREVFLRAQGLKTRGFPDRDKKIVVKESEGIPQAFNHFMKAFRPPNGSLPQVVMDTVNDRISQISD